jgi:hypothetical protein
VDESNGGLIAMTIHRAITAAIADRGALHLKALALAVVFGITAITLSAPTATAAGLNVVGGQLQGATNVNVGGVLYDVDFVDGTCIALFDGCDENDDFTFKTNADGLLAAQALLDQVFLDGPLGNFDTHPEFTTGCSDTDLCFPIIPYSVDNPQFPGYLKVAVAYNRNPTYGTDSTSYNFFTHPTWDVTDYTNRNYAIFTKSAVVAEPTALPLLGTGLLALFIIQRRRFWR